MNSGNKKNIQLLNLSDKINRTPNQPYKFKSWVEINDDSRERIKLIFKLNLKLQV